MPQPHGKPTTWREAIPPNMATGRTTGLLRGCDYCGSMHPADVAAAITAGATIDPADRKYGWPHKFYVHDVPNPHAGMLESRCSRTNPPQAEIDAGKWVSVPSGFNPSTGAQEFSWHEAGTPAAATTMGKFYTEHLQDASPEDRKVIDRALGMNITFTDEGVSWAAFVEA